MEKTIFQTVTVNRIELSASLVLPEVEMKGIILYFHGGGLIFGDKDDLPIEYLELFSQAGYGIVSFDYPFAPESDIEIILKCAKEQIQWYFQEGVEKLSLQDGISTFLMGRSAGSFLAAHLTHEFKSKIKGYISFYGYYNLNDAHFTIPNHHYLKFGKVDENQFKRLVNNIPTIADSNDARYLIYLYARQTGRFQDLLVPQGEKASDYSLKPADLKEFPATFITAGEVDPDVPVRQSRLMAKYVPHSQLHILEVNEHDFDRTQISGVGIPIYTKLVDWMNTLIK